MEYHPLQVWRGGKQELLRLHIQAFTPAVPPAKVGAQLIPYQVLTRIWHHSWTQSQPGIIVYVSGWNHALDGCIGSHQHGNKNHVKPTQNHNSGEAYDFYFRSNLCWKCWMLQYLENFEKPTLMCNMPRHIKKDKKVLNFGAKTCFWHCFFHEMYSFHSKDSKNAIKDTIIWYALLMRILQKLMS